MIVLLFAICGICGLVVGGLCGVVWYGAAMLFGFAVPTPDQLNGLLLLFSSVSALGSAAIAGYVVITDG